MEATFEHALLGLREAGASVDIRDLVEVLAQHGAEEGKILSTYEDVANSSTNKGAKYLVGLILEDERRHHRLLAEMANAMAWGSFGGTDEAAIPMLSRGVDDDLLAQTTVLRKAEETDYRELKRLRKQLRPFAQSTMWALIIDMLLLDTEKHATVLRFLEKQGHSQ
jgi:hypothetical protein